MISEKNQLILKEFGLTKMELHALGLSQSKGRRKTARLFRLRPISARSTSLERGRRKTKRTRTTRRRLLSETRSITIGTKDWSTNTTRLRLRTNEPVKSRTSRGRKRRGGEGSNMR